MLVVHQPSRQEIVVGAEIEEPVTAQVEQDRLLLPFLVRRFRFDDRAVDGMRRFRRRQDPLGLREGERALENHGLGVGLGLDQPLVVELADERRIPVVPEPSGVDPRGDEVVTEGIHLDERREPGGVAEIVGIYPLGQRRAGRRLDRYDPRVLRSRDLVPEEREADAGEVAPSAAASDDHVRVVAGDLHLLLALLPDHRLVEKDMVQHRAEGVARVLPRRRVLDGLADRDAERARGFGIAGEDLLSAPGVPARGGDDLRAVRLHEHPAVRLLVVADLDHVDLRFESEKGGSQRERGAPLPRSGLGGDRFPTGHLVVVGLGHGGVRLVAPRGAHPLVLVVDPRPGADRRLQPRRPVHRRRPPQCVDFPDLLRDRDEPLPGHLLLDERHGEERGQVVRGNGLSRPRMQNRRRRVGHVGDDVVPDLRHLRVFQDDLRFHRFAPFHAVDRRSFPVKLRTASSGSPDRTSISPTRNASAPSAWYRRTSSREEIPLSTTFTASRGARGSRRREVSRSTRRVERFRLLIPTIAVPERAASSISSSSCTSTRASMPYPAAARIIPSVLSPRTATISRTRSAPHARDSAIMYSSRRKSFRRTGTDPHASPAEARSESDPPKKRFSVSTETAHAPPRAYARAVSAASSSFRIHPFDGDARLISAMIPGASPSPARRLRLRTFRRARSATSANGAAAFLASSSSQTPARIRSTWEAVPVTRKPPCARGRRETPPGATSRRPNRSTGPPFRCLPGYRPPSLRRRRRTRH